MTTRLCLACMSPMTRAARDSDWLQPRSAQASDVPLTRSYLPRVLHHGIRNTIGSESKNSRSAYIRLPNDIPAATTPRRHPRDWSQNCACCVQPSMLTWLPIGPDQVRSNADLRSPASIHPYIFLSSRTWPYRSGAVTL
jgi:hypothetical protein